MIEQRQPLIVGLANELAFRIYNEMPIIGNNVANVLNDWSHRDVLVIFMPIVEFGLRGEVGFMACW